MAWPWLAKLFGARTTSEPRSPTERKIPYTGRTQAGVYVTPDRALMNDVIWAGHRYLTQTVGQLPARVMRQTGTSTSERVSSHPVDTLLNWRPNPELAPFQLKETLTGWALLHGNGVAEIEPDLVGRVVNLWPIEPHRIQFLRAVEPMIDARDTPILPGELVYQINNGLGGHTILASRNVFHIRGFGNGPVGLSVVEYAAQSIGWARATELFGASYFGEGLHFGGAAILPGEAGPDDVKRVRAELDVFRGPNRSGKWFIGDAGMKLEKMTATPDEAQFVATMQHQVEAICRWMGVPPHKVMHLLRATFSNIEHQSIEVVVDSITPWAIRFEEECNYKLFGQNRQGFFVKLDLKGLLRGDFKTRQEGLQIQRRNGVIHADYWAEVEDMPKPGQKNGGQIYIVEGNMTRLDQVGEQPQQPARSPAVPANDPRAAAALADIRTVVDLELVDAA